MGSKNRTVRKRLEALSRDLLEHDAYQDETGAQPNETEQAFAILAKQKGKTPLRNGWPDFLVYDELSGGTIGVEVKQGNDTVSHAQARMFRALERAGITVMVWDPAWPRTLQRWRRYYDDKPVEQSAGSVPRPPTLQRMPAKNRRDR